MAILVKPCAIDRKTGLSILEAPETPEYMDSGAHGLSRLLMQQVSGLMPKPESTTRQKNWQCGQQKLWQLRLAEDTRNDDRSQTLKSGQPHTSGCPNKRRPVANIARSSEPVRLHQRCPFENLRSSTGGVWAADESQVLPETARR